MLMIKIKNALKEDNTKINKMSKFVDKNNGSLGSLFDARNGGSRTA